MAPDLAVPVAAHQGFSLAEASLVTINDSYRRVLADGVSVPKARRYANRRPLLRGCGVASPASASFASILAGHCARAALADRPGPPLRQDRLAVILGSALAALDPSHQLELCGLREGWDLIDPFRFPHTLPSACAATVAAAVGARALTLACRDNALASLRAVDLAAMAVLHGRADHVLVGGAEEVSDLVLLLLAASRRPDFLSPPGVAPSVPITEIAVVGLLERAHPEGDPGVIVIEGYGEVTGPLTEADVERFRAAFSSVRFDLVLSNMASQHHRTADIRAAVEALLEPPTEIVHTADSLGDTHGAAGAVALAVLAQRPPGTRALVISAGRDLRLGFLVASRASGAERLV